MPDVKRNRNRAPRMIKRVLFLVYNPGCCKTVIKVFKENIIKYEINEIPHGL